MPQKDFAPETAVGTGAAEPVVDEYEAAKEVPSVDEKTLNEGRSQNQPGRGATIDYSGESHVEATKDLGQEPAANDTEKSTGEDLETRRQDDDTLAGASVKENDDSNVNKKAEETRPEVPQATDRKAAERRKRA
jgi:hypothetical protein